ncbi:MAG: capsule assembly Wzi family protein [Nitrospiraceae bacterium]|nr:capsule assembly Wzi family protein [Nitrospiraceae bacterium]
MVFRLISRLGFLAFAVCFAFILSARAFASTYVPVGDDAYNMLFRLEAEGLITSGLLDTLPISRSEMQRLISETEKNAAARGRINKEDKQEIHLLKSRFGDGQKQRREYIRPLEEAYARYVYASSNPLGNGLNYSPAANPNGFVYDNNGDDYGNGSNFRLGFSSLADLGWFSFYINPEYRYTGTSQIDLNKMYGVVSAVGLDLEVGRDSQWWGPGHNGVILLSNNSDPFTMIKLTNDRPALLPWIFGYLGLTKFTAFVTKLGGNANPQNPYLWGLRIELKPLPYLEIGLARVAQLGGRDRPEGLQTWINSFTGAGENGQNGAASDPGKQEAGGNVKVTLPFSFQPAQMYFEAAGTDQCGILPCKWAKLAGIYLPRILNFNRFDFRAEYANDHVTGYPDVWYSRGTYNFTYPADKDLIIGHHMGTDSDDLFLKTGYFIPEIGGRVYLSYDREKHNLSGVTQPFKPVQNAATLGAYLYTKKNYSLNAQYTYGWITDTPQGDLDINLFTMGVTRYF